MEQFVLVCKPIVGLNNILHTEICRPAIVRCVPKQNCTINLIVSPPLNKPIKIGNTNLCELKEFEENKEDFQVYQDVFELNDHKEQDQDYHELP